MGLGSILGDITGMSKAVNPATAGFGFALSGLGMIGSAMTNKPSYSTNVSSYLDKGLTDKANQYTDLNSDYYKLGEEQLRRTMMDAAPTGNSLLGLAAATGGSATQAGLQRRASESKVGEGVKTGLLGMYNQGAQTGLGYNQLNYQQANQSLGARADLEWDKYNSTQQQWSQLSGVGGGLINLGFAKSNK